MAIFAGVGRIAGRKLAFVNENDGKLSELTLSDFRKRYGKSALGFSTGTVIHPVVLPQLPTKPDVGMSASEIPSELKLKVETWMRETIPHHNYGSAFDLAVDAAYELELTGKKQDWEIPVYAVEIAESIMGPDNVEEKST